MSIRALLGKKIGTTQHFDDQGRATCVTAIEVGPCTVTQIKTVEQDGYSGVQLGFEEIKKPVKSAGLLWFDSDQGLRLRYSQRSGPLDLSCQYRFHIRPVHPCSGIGNRSVVFQSDGRTDPDRCPVR